MALEMALVMALEMTLLFGNFAKLPHIVSSNLQRRLPTQNIDRKKYLATQKKTEEGGHLTTRHYGN